MRELLYFFLFMLHFSTGCIVSDKQQTVRIIGYTGGSVVLPCSCADPQSRATTVTWQFQSSGNRWIPVFEDEKYSGRRVLFNEHSPTNLSLLITDLRTNDQGYYKCLTESNTFTHVDLKVTGCDLFENRKTVAATGYSGESVVLPCSCTELLAKPEQIQWMYFIAANYKEIYPNEQIKSYENRVKLLNPNTPGNLSLHISALTTEDEGYYQCYVSSHQVVAVRLTVLHAEEKPHINTITLTTHQPSHQTQDSSTSQLQPTQLNVTPNQHHTPYYVFILLGVFFSVLLLALLAFIWWRCRGSRNYKKVTTNGEELKTEQENQDDVMYSTVVHVKTASTPAHTHNDPAEFSEYARINVKR
ncbi:polymeric immunoglobulin receptor-like [Labeo rohita]|uniref:polymeric immunoglobulin receptor-like n=1 Tax=Labeo rohita TaxID=84645 RepID=UPI0021E2CC20|nr:polymeric immunoglobulin receptor-like [Labeo rohita]